MGVQAQIKTVNYLAKGVIKQAGAVVAVAADTVGVLYNYALDNQVDRIDIQNVGVTPIKISINPASDVDKVFVAAAYHYIIPGGVAPGDGLGGTLTIDTLGHHVVRVYGINVATGYTAAVTLYQNKQVYTRK